MIKVGIGPSSSHTMGPWNAALSFVQHLEKISTWIDRIDYVKVTLFGSLAKTGKGHGTDLAIILGLSGLDYKTLEKKILMAEFQKVLNEGKIFLNQKLKIDFEINKHLIFNFKESLDYHPNGMRFKVYFKDQIDPILVEEYFSVGGGFITDGKNHSINEHAIKTPYPCHKANDIILNCEKLNLSVSKLVMLNEKAWQDERQIKQDAILLWNEMKECIFRGLNADGMLPGGLNVKRRAKELCDKLSGGKKFSDSQEFILYLKSSDKNFSQVNKWVSAFALAVNEENASFGKIVTAPTNGAAGVIPAVLMYAHVFMDHIDEEKIIDFILVAGEIATIFKKNATISAAMGGCQAEIGVSSAMAASALADILGGTPGQVLMAGEIAMEHHLGLTCDPVLGLVQIPCIERNSMGAIKAITAALMALESDPLSAKVSLDDVIKSMWETALDMNHKYKETSEGGLATNLTVNLTSC